jgi:hypothetical protein
MTPKDKAIQLIDAFDDHAESRISDNGRGFDKKYCSKQCALIAVQERIDEGSYWMGGGNTEWEKDRYNYWQEVKQEIEKL